MVGIIGCKVFPVTGIPGEGVTADSEQLTIVKAPAIDRRNDLFM
jgi:hypothetical protein